MLWGRAASRCSFCRLELVMDSSATDDESLIGEACHRVASSADGPRGDSSLSMPQRDKYSNLILLCNVHHKQVDDQHASFTISRLQDIKAVHEDWVKQALKLDSAKQHDSEVMAGYVEEWAKRIELDDWMYWTSGTMCHGIPVIGSSQFKALKDVRQWILSRVWPSGYTPLVAALLNFRLVAQDFCLVFVRHSIENAGEYWTEKFYRQDCDWTQERENTLLALFDAHVGLVQHLMVELTRAANLISQTVRETLLPSYRISEGVALLEAGPYSDMTFTKHRPEYTMEERRVRPYPGLAAFRTSRFKRALHFGRAEDET